MYFVIPLIMCLSSNTFENFLLELTYPKYDFFCPIFIRTDLIAKLDVLKNISLDKRMDFSSEKHKPCIQ